MYIGQIEWGGVSNPNGQHEKLIDEETFYKVQELMKARNYGANKDRKHILLLRGIAWCGTCGSRITGSFHKKKDKVYAHYYCQKRQHSKRVVCDEPVFFVEDGEMQLQEFVKTIQIPQSTADRLRLKIEAVAAKQNESNASIHKTLTAQLGHIDTRRKSLMEKFVDGAIDSQAYQKYKVDLEEQEAKYRVDLERVGGSLAKMEAKMKHAIDLAENCYRAYRKASYEQKIILAQTFFEKVIVKNKKIVEVNLNPPFQLICQIKASRKPEFKKQYQGSKDIISGIEEMLEVRS